MVDFDALTRANLARWQNAKLTRKALGDAVAMRLLDAKGRYQAVEARTGVPWFVIAVIHERESSQSWKGSLAQGDPWDRVSVHVPAGRGPFASWEEAAVDALANCHPYLAKRKDWSLAGVLTALELYNGLGYASRGVPSPYLWAGTDQYRAGKYVRDGVYDPGRVDAQLGCAALLLSMMERDPTIAFAGRNTGPPPTDAPKPDPKPAPAQSAWSVFISAALKFVGRK